MDNGKVVQASDYCCLYQNVRALVALNNKYNDGIFEWDVIVEKVDKDCDTIYIGVCASADFDREDADEWVLKSNGICLNDQLVETKYCPTFGEGAKITVHLDMNNKTCVFTINGKGYPIVSNWNNLPSELHPVVSLRTSGRLRIQPHQKS